MKYKTALTIIFFIAIAGLLFSGYLSYNELFKASCGLNGAITCGATQPIPGIPVCVIGFIMYAIILLIDSLALFSKKD